MITFDFTHFGEEQVFGGLSDTKIIESESSLHKVINGIYQKKPGFISMLDDLSFVEEILGWASRASQFDHVVVLGIGGSALGNIALQQTLRSTVWNFLSKEERMGFPKIMIWDNIDPDWIGAQMDLIDPSKTLFNVISKSGTTAESMASFLIVKGILMARGLDPKRHILITTDPQKGVLREIAKQESIPSLPIPEEVGGRFSVLTAVGLVSAAMSGIDVTQVLKSAQHTCKQLQHAQLSENPAGMIALTHAHFIQRGMSMSVMLAYSNRLYALADWYRQIWAESLGKRYNLEGEEVFTGMTPIKALGATDQHSQIQLYVEGPRDKVITLLCVDQFDRTLHIPAIHQDVEALSYLGGRTMNELMQAELDGTQVALTQMGVPNMKVIFSTINEESVGAFFFVYELATVILGALMNINPYDQPGVEAGKIAAYALMGRKGYEQQAEKIGKVSRNSKEIKIQL